LKLPLTEKSVPTPKVVEVTPVNKTILELYASVPSSVNAPVEPAAL
jgi:hypothetical protein